MPALLRRRFKTLGKVASAAMFNLKEESSSVPTLFASRHGDTELTLQLLQSIAQQELMSPTKFSLAVHNAIGGLLSIVRQDQSPMTAISASDGLVAQTFFELKALLTQYPRVMCVIYDVPLPEVYQPYAESLDFPLAVAFVANQQYSDIELKLTQSDKGHHLSKEIDLLTLVKLFSGDETHVTLDAGKQAWTLRKVNAS